MNWRLAAAILLLWATGCAPATAAVGQRTEAAADTASPAPAATSIPAAALATNTPAPVPTPTERITAAPSASPTSTVSATATAAGSPAPTAAGVGISIVGSDAFVAQTMAAISFLLGCAPQALATADIYIETIVESDRSGMVVEAGSFLASSTTAFAPGYSQAAQVYWYAGTIVHDARHRWQSQNGMTTNWDALDQSGREAIEADARGVQIAALEQCTAAVAASARHETDFMLKYLNDMQNGITPCDYCAVEWANRNW